VWWNGGARRQTAHHQRSATPHMVSKGNSWQRADLARRVLEEGERTSRDTQPWWTAQIAWIYEARQECMTACAGKHSVYFVWWDDVYLPRGLPNAYCLSLSPSPLSLYLRMYTYRETWILRHQVPHRACAEVSAAFEVSHRPAQRSQRHQNLTILIVKFRSILNAPPSLQVLSEAHENALAESESTLQCSKGGWEYLEVLRSTDEGYRSTWEVCVRLPDRITYCWCRHSRWQRRSFSQLKCSRTIMLKEWPGCFEDLCHVQNVSHGGLLLVSSTRFPLGDTWVLPSVTHLYTVVDSGHSGQWPVLCVFDHFRVVFCVCYIQFWVGVCQNPVIDSSKLPSNDFFTNDLACGFWLATAENISAKYNTGLHSDTMWYDTEYVAHHIWEIGVLCVRFLLLTPPVG